MSKSKTLVIPTSAQSAYKTITALTDGFSRARLTDEYAELCRELAAALGRKRPSPLLRGKPETWASGIIHALGVVNFLFDSTQKPHVSPSELFAALGVSASTANNRSRFIRQTFGMSAFDPRWTLPSKLGDNPLVWMVVVNGVVADVRDLSRDVQVAAHQQGLIPYMPADQPKGPTDLGRENS